MDSKKINYFVLFFLFFFFSPGIWFLIEYSVLDLPETVLKERGKVRRRYFYENKFTLKKLILTLNNQLNLKISKVKEMNGVHIGKEGWFFLRPEGAENPFELYKGRSLISDIEKQRVSRFLNEKVNQYSSYYFVVAPNKHTLYPGKLQTFFPVELYRNSSTPILELEDNLRSILGDRYISLLADFKQTRLNKFTLYKKLDTHWSDRGSLEAYKSIIDKLSKDYQISNISLIEKIRFIQAVEESGDLSHMLQRGTNRQFDRYMVKENIDWLDESSLLKVETRFQSEDVIHIYNSKAEKKIFVIGDSFIFATVLKKLFPLNFKETIFLKGFHLIDSAILKFGKPDIIVHERVERGLRRLGL